MLDSLLPKILRTLSRRSLRWLHFLGVVAGWSTYLFSATYRKRFDANAAAASIAPQRARPAVASAGRMVLELPYLWFREDDPISPLVTWRGGAVLEAALAEALSHQRGLLFLTPHLGCFEVIAQAYAERYGAMQPITVLYRPSRQRLLRDLVDGARERPHLHTAPASLAGVRQMIRALRRGEAVGLLPDQVPPDGMGVWAPFFGQPAYTMTLASRLAQQTGAQIILMRCERREAGLGYTIEVTNPVESLPQGAANDASHQVACAALINREMERLILRCPGQYLWAYDRYKSPRTERAPQA